MTATCHECASLRRSLQGMIDDAIHNDDVDAQTITRLKAQVKELREAGRAALIVLEVDGRGECGGAEMLKKALENTK